MLLPSSGSKNKQNKKRSRSNGLFFESEGRGDMLVRNVSWLSVHHEACSVFVATAGDKPEILQVMNVFGNEVQRRTGLSGCTVGGMRSKFSKSFRKIIANCSLEPKIALWLS